MTEEEQAAKEYADAGVDLPELKDGESKVSPEQKAADEAKAQEAADAQAKADADAAKAAEAKDKGDDDEKLPPPPKEEKKRSIYDEYKDKKSEAKSEKDARIKAEQERDELLEKLKGYEAAKTTEEKKDAKDEIEALAAEINADPETLRKMRATFLKDVKPSQGLSDEDRKILNDAKAVSLQNQKVAEKQQFEEEFSAVAPTIKELFPNASSEELTAIKAELETLAHSNGWHDKSLDYIVFKHKDVLTSLVSPKKRGLESKSRKDTGSEAETTFDPNADYSKMNMKEREAWEKEYKRMTTSDQLVTDAQGRKLLI